MRISLQHTWILLVLLTMTETTHVTNKFTSLRPGKNITGQVKVKFMARSRQKCALSCLNEKNCIANQYKETGARNCIIIQRNSSDTAQHSFQNDIHIITYTRHNPMGQLYWMYPEGCNSHWGVGVEESSEASTLSSTSTELTSVDQTTVSVLSSRELAPTTNTVCQEPVSSETWSSPPGWIGPCAALYYSFDVSDGLVLMEGTQEVGSPSIVSGKLSFALNFDGTKKQWIDLGIHTEACMTRPETCGAAGGTISLWVNLIDCPSAVCGIVSTVNFTAEGSVIYWASAAIGVDLHLPDLDFFTPYGPFASGWIHLVVNYIGTNNGEGIRIYYNGQEVASDTNKHGGPSSAGDGRIVVGKRYIDIDDVFGSFKVDELIFFNETLTNDNIDTLYNAV